MKNKLLLALLSISLLFGNENYIKVNASSSIDVINEEIISNNNEQVNLLQLFLMVNQFQVFIQLIMQSMAIAIYLLTLK